MHSSEKVVCTATQGEAKLLADCSTKWTSIESVNRNREYSPVPDNTVYKRQFLVDKKNNQLHLSCQSGESLHWAEFADLPSVISFFIKCVHLSPTHQIYDSSGQQYRVNQLFCFRPVFLTPGKLFLHVLPDAYFTTSTSLCTYIQHSWNVHFDARFQEFSVKTTSLYKSCLCI